MLVDITNKYIKLLFMKVLTKAEENIMQVLWHIEKGFVKDMAECMGSSSVYGHGCAYANSCHHIAYLADDVIGKQLADVISQYCIYYSIECHHHAHVYEYVPSGKQGG